MSMTEQQADEMIEALRQIAADLAEIRKEMKGQHLALSSTLKAIQRSVDGVDP